MNHTPVNRKDFLRLSGLLAGAGLLAACAPKTVEVEKTVEVTRPVEVTRVVEVQQNCAEQPKTIKTFPWAPIFEAETFNLRGGKYNEPYDIFVSFPGDYDTSGETKYPVLYMTDADMLFCTVNGLVSALGWIEKIPSMLVVGIGYQSKSPMDWYEKSTQNMDDALPGIEDFLILLSDKIIPTVESRYPVNQKRFVFGMGVGANFCLYAMLKYPTLFQYIIASSPLLLGEGEESLYMIEDAAAAKYKSLPVNLFLSSNQELMKNTQAFKAKLEQRGYSDLKIQYTTYDEPDAGVVYIPALWYGFPQLMAMGSAS